MRKCTHCASEHTPQWRKGPMGPKTLCNACGVRYKSGRLAPEYRPAASPTFTPTQHSNSHQKVLELQQQNERSSSSSFLSEGVRKCTHSASERTLQWRIGPMGPKTLCNACGVWYNSGRLAPEYRPAASPMFTPTQHSNSHQKVLELQQQNEREEVNCHDDFHDHNQQQQQQHDFKMATVTRSSRKLKDDDNSSPKSKHLSDKGSTTLGSMATDTSGLRRSARETPSKKQSVSSPSSKRKSERIEKRMPPTPPIQRKPERVLKQRTPSPLKSSDRLENHLSSSSSGSKKPGKSLSPSSSPLITEKKKEKIEKNEKQPMENGIDERENEEKSRRPIRIVFKKNRMDARSYKQLLLKAKERKAQKSDEKLKSHDLLSQGETDNTEAIGSKEVADEAECSGRKGGELRGEESGEGCEGSGEGSSSGSEKLNTDRPSNHEETEPWHSDRIRKDPPEEGHDCDNKVGPPLSKYSNNFLQSSPRLVAEERVGNAAGAKLGCSGSETLQKPVVMESISEGRSVSCDHDLGKAHSVGSSKRNRKVEDLDFDASATPTSKEIPVSNDAVCSSPAEKNAAKQCVACSKRRRLDYNSLENTCFCNCEKFIDLCGTAPPEEVHKQAAVLVSPQNDQSPMHCILNDGNKDDRDQIDGKQLEVGHLTVVQRETVQDRDELCITVEISNCSDEDGREMRSRDSDIPIEEHSNMELRGPTDTQTESDHNAHVISKPGGKILYVAIL